MKNTTHTKDETKQILLQLSGVNWLMGQIIYGAGLRIMECVRLRVKDVDFNYRQIVIRDGKGKKDRVTMLPNIIIEVSVLLTPSSQASRSVA